MLEKFEGATSPQESQESLEDLRYQLKRVGQEHAQLLQASQNDPKDSELRVKVDEAYSRWSNIRAKIEQITGEEEQ